MHLRIKTRPNNWASALNVTQTHTVELKEARSNWTALKFSPYYCIYKSMFNYSCMSAWPVNVCREKSINRTRKGSVHCYPQMKRRASYWLIVNVFVFRSINNRGYRRSIESRKLTAKSILWQLRPESSTWRIIALIFAEPNSVSVADAFSSQVHGSQVSGKQKEIRGETEEDKQGEIRF